MIGKKKRIIVVEISPEGVTEVKTVKNGGKQCKAVVDQFALETGQAVDNSSRRDTPDLYVKASEIKITAG